MLGMGSATVAGLDIGFYSIKILEMSVGKKQQSIRRLIEVPTGFTPNLTEEEREQRLIGLLQSAWKEHGVKSRRVHTIIPGRSVFYRPLKIPIVTGDRLEKIIRYEAKQQIPFPLDQILLDYHVFGGSGGELEGILIAVRNDTINDHVRLLGKAGLRIDAIQESSICLFNATRGMQREPDEVIGIVNIGASTTDIIIEHDHVLKFRRSAPVAGNELTLALQNSLERSFEECEDLKIRFGRLSTSEESRFEGLPGEWAEIDEFQVVDLLDGAFERVVTDIRRSIDYYISQPDGMAVSRLVITGGAVDLPGTVEFLEDRLGIPVEKLDPAACTSVDISNIESEECAGRAMIACGLAAPAAGEHQVPMSFIPESIRQRKEFEQKRSYIVIQGIFLALLVVASVLFLQKELQFRKEILEDIEAVVNKDRSRIGEEFYRVLKQQEEMRLRFTRLNEIADRRGKIMNNLLEIVKITPLDYASITSINIEHDHMLIKGEATNDEGMKAFVEELRISPFIAEMKNVTKEGSGNAFIFEITKLHEPNEKERTFYSALRPLRPRLPHFRNFRLGNQQYPKRIIFSFYEHINMDDLCEEFTTVLEILVNSGIEYEDVDYRVFNIKEEQMKQFRFKTQDEVMKVYHGEIGMCDFITQFEEEFKRKQEEREKAERERRRGAPTQ